MTTKFKLGDILKDAVTGFEGVVLAMTVFYTGCIHYALQPRKLNKEGKENDWAWYDESRLTFAGKRLELPGQVKTPARSGPFPHAPKP